MRKHARFTGKLHLDDGHNVEFRLTLIFFEEDGMTICYCPALDLSAYGETEAQAKENYEIAMGEYFAYTSAKKTLHQDLRQRGWLAQGRKNRRLVPPPTSRLMEMNREFKRLVDTVPYKSIPTSVTLPAYA